MKSNACGGLDIFINAADVFEQPHVLDVNLVRLNSEWNAINLMFFTISEVYSKRKSFEAD